MKTAEQILKKRAFIKEEMDRRLPKEQSGALWYGAEKRLGEILDRYRTLPKGVRIHTERYIFPAAAVYLTLKEELGEQEAYRILEDSAVKVSVDAGRSLAKLVSLPGMRSMLIKAFDLVVRKVFSHDNGFTNVFYPREKNVYRMDVTACPYCRYFGELGCPELTKIYCENDNRVYGKLPGIVFERTGTLGTGADKCDFCVRKE